MGNAGAEGPEQLIRLARHGAPEVLGRLLDAFRSYLKLLARLQIDRRLQGKIDASDLVQETFMEANRTFAGFRGSTEAELQQWLRRILATKMAKVVRHFYGTQRRDLRLERQLNEELDRSSAVATALALAQSSPSERAARREQAVVLANALERLPADYRRVIDLRQLEELTFPEVASRMGRSVGGVQQLWIRALTALRRLLEGEFHGSG